MKYTKEIKEQAVEAAKSGMSLKAIQTTIGPNPKATMRYLAALGINYKELKEELKASGVLEPTIRKNKSGREEDAKKSKAKAEKKSASKAKDVVTEEIIEE